MLRPAIDSEPLDTPASSWLTRIAFGGAIVLVIARALLPQYLRDTEPLAPLATGEPLPTRAAGPAVGVILDSLTLLLAVFVLLRATMDREWRLLRTWSILPLALVALWAFASTAWASDKFAAAASASTWLAAAGLVFVFAQTVRTWSRLRVVAGIAAGLFLANVAFGIIYRTIDLPDLIEEFERTKLEYFEQRGWEPDSFAAKNFEHRVMQGATGGFAASPNSFAATLVMLGFVTAGLVWQRWRERSEPAWAGILALALLPGAYILWTTASRTAMAAAMLAGLALAFGFWRRDLLARDRGLTFAGIVALVALGAAAVVVIGVSTGTLPHESLAFRWNYWRGAWGVFAEDPLRGVGFANFGDAYLAHRPPVAAEEVKDPHNLLVRFFSETGVIGGALAAAWLLGFIWSQTRPAARPDDEQQVWRSAPMSLASLTAIILLGIAVHSLAAIDFTADAFYVFLEVVRRGLYALLILGAALLGTIRSAQDPQVTTSPAPALLAAMLAGLGAALLHAMVDVVIFEPPVLMSFAMLMGAVVGIRAPEAAPGAYRRAIAPLAGAAAIAVISYVLFFAVPLVVAELKASEADALVRGGKREYAFMFEKPLSLYESAAEWSPVQNSDYHRRAALAAAYAQRPPGESEAALLRAIAVNPRSISDRVALAGLYAGAYLEPRLSDAAKIYAQIVNLNPNDLGLRMQYADALARLNRGAEAAEQLERVLWFNDQLNPEEPERLKPEDVEQLQQRISSLRGGV